MAKTATFEIVINGIKESISGIDSINKQLDALEKRLDEISKKNINVKVSGGGGNSAALDEEAKILQKIDQLHQKVAASEKQEYQELLAAKAELKEYETIAKSVAAQTALEQKHNNLNTMQGMKAQLKDIKAAMQTIDIDSDKFRELQQEANELNNKLKEIEQGYGQFGRNVGNYAEGVAQGMSKLKIEIGDSVVEFDNATKAYRTLKKEMETLSTKQDLGTISEEEANRLKSLVPVVKQLGSSIQDAGKPMDALLDTMQSFVAIAQGVKGISAIFGLDSDAIEESIQKLVALQNVMQSLQTIQKQLQTQEGIGGWLAKSNKMVDTFAANLLKVDKNAAAASKSVKVLSTSLKVLGGLGVAAAIIAITVALNKLNKERARAEAVEQKELEIVKAGAEAYKKAEIELNGYIKRLDSFNGTKKQEKILLDEVIKKYDIHNKNIKNVKDMKELLIKMAPTYLETVKEEAKATALAGQAARLYAEGIELMVRRNNLQAKYDNLSLNDKYTGWAMKMKYDIKELNEELDINAKTQDTVNKKLEESQKIVQKGKETLSGYGIGGKESTKKVKDDSKKVEEAVRQAQNNINDLKLKLMKDGLYKELAQLDENNRREIQKIEENGQKVREQKLLQEELYQKQLKELYDKYLGELTNSNYLNGINNASEAIQRLREEWESLYLVLNRPTSTKDAPLFGLQEETAGVAYKQLKKWKDLYDIRNDELSKNNWEGYFEALKTQYLPKAAKEVQEEFNRILAKTRPDAFEGYLDTDFVRIKDIEKEAYEYLKGQFEEQTSELKYFLTKYQGTVEITERGITQSLEDSYLERVSLLSERYKNMLDVTNKYIQDKLELDIDAIDKEEEIEKEAVDKRLKTTREGYEKLLSESKKYSAYTPESVAEYLRGKDDLTEEEKNLQKFIILIDEQEKERTQIVQKYTNQRKKLQLDANNEMLQNNAKYYDKSIDSIEEFMQKASELISNQPQRIGLFNFTDISASKKQYKEVLDMYKHMEDDLSAIIYEALQAVNSKDPAQRISGEQFERVMQNVEFYKKKIKESTKEIKQNIKDLLPNLMKDIDFWIQQVGQAATSIIQSIGEINDAAFERQMEDIDKQNELLEKKLEKQKEITEKYADKIDDIEGELSESRGDRRQFLIDQLNAEMEAERESLKQQQMIEKQQEALEEKKKKLEYDNEMRKWEQSKLTAAINAALAISNAAVNSWPIPAVPMITLATAVGAAQVAAVLANKPRKYAEGGLLEGKSHAQGGIRAGGVELEGNEYIVNKKTTMQNLPLMDFINSKKKRLDIDDMIEFYSSGIKKNVSIPNKTKFADGGQLPTLRSDIDLEGNVLRAIEQYNNRNIVVSVVDIMNKSDEVKNVQVLAGLS